MKINILPPVQEKILAIFLADQEKQWYINELIRKTKEYPNAVQYSLISLNKQGYLQSDLINNRKFYWLNYQNPFLDNIRDILVKKALLPESNQDELSSPWIKLLNREASLAFQVEVPIINRDVLPKIIHNSIGNFWYNGITYGVYYKKEDLKFLADAVERKILKDKKFVKENIRNCYRLGEKLLHDSSVSKTTNLKNMSNRKLLGLLKKFRSSYQLFLPYLMYPHLIERYFVEKIKKEVESESILTTLTTPTIHEIEEQIDMLEVAYEIKKRGWGKQTQALVGKLHEKYSWQPYWTVNARPLALDYYKDAALVLSKSKTSLPDEIRRIKKEQEDRKKNLVKTLDGIKASSTLRSFVEILQAYIYLRTYRKNIISRSHFLHMPLLKEIGVRMKIGNDIYLVSYSEMEKFLQKKEKITKDIIRKRKEGWGIIAVNGFVEIISGKKEVLEVMERFQIGKLPLAPAVHTVIKGMPACMGNVIGTVRIVNGKKEFSKIRQGDILVTQMTTPDFVPLLKKIVGIITDEGGVTCHAAIISREYAIPCIVATGNATKILQDGDQVELNAYTGTIKVYDKALKQSNQVVGKMLYKGKVKGTVVNIASDEDLKKVTSTSIIVSNSVTPQYLSALYIGRGFVVDEYSPTSHSFLYANALMIPAVGGTKIASKILQTGDKIILDATRGIITKLHS